MLMLMLMLITTGGVSAIHAQTSQPDTSTPASQTAEPMRGIQQLETRFFTIIYPPEAAESARKLAAYADELYIQAAQLLGVETDLKLPVYFSTASDVLNGFYTPLPYPRIELIQAHISPGQGFALFDDPLKALFFHELVHAVSLNLSPGWWKILSGIFYQGGAGASLLAAPANFIEGVTVWFESMGGFGRANDTPYAAVIQQDILEGRFKTFTETSGMRTDTPGGLWYIYGGWFSRYLMEEYGREAYQEIWQRIGSFESIQPGLFSPGIVAEVTGRRFDLIWEGFRRWMSIKKPVSLDLRPIENRARDIWAITAHNDILYVADTLGIHAIHPTAGEVRNPAADNPASDKLISEKPSSETLISGTIYANRLSVSDDGRFLLISGASYADAAYNMVYRLWVYDLETRELHPLQVPEKISEASWAPDGSIIAVQSRQYTADVVRLTNPDRAARPEAEENSRTRTTSSKDWLDFTQSHVLYQGSHGIIPSLPQTWQNGILLILSVHGQNTLMLLNPDGQASVPVLPPQTQIRGIRHLWTNNNEALFVYDNDLSMLKLGRLSQDPSSSSREKGENGTPSTLTSSSTLTSPSTLTLQTTPISGGIQYPVMANNQIYYVGYLGTGQFLMAYPQEAQSGAYLFDGSWSPESGKYAGEPNQPLETISLPVSWSTLNLPLLPEESHAAQTLQPKPYNPLTWALYPYIRYPVLDLHLSAADPSDWIRGAGLGMQSLDPTGWLGLTIQTGYNWRERLIPFSLDISFTNPWGMLSLTGSDDLQYFTDSQGEWGSRVLSAGVAASGAVQATFLNQRLLWGMSAQGIMGAIGTLNPADSQSQDQFQDPNDKPESAYNWPLSYPIVGGGAQLIWSDYKTGPQVGSDRGWSLGLAWNGVLDTSSPGLPEGLASGNINIILPGFQAGNGPGLSPGFTIIGAAATHPQVYVGPSGADSQSRIIRYSPSAFSPFPGYETAENADASWYAGAMATLGTTFIVNAELPLGLYVTAIDITGLYRGAWAGGLQGSWLDTAGFRITSNLHYGDSMASNLPLKLSLEVGSHFQKETPMYAAWSVVF